MSFARRQSRLAERARSGQGIDKVHCPFCGKVVFLNHAQKKVSHEAPECEKFTRFVMMRPGECDTFLEQLDLESGKPVEPEA